MNINKISYKVFEGPKEAKRPFKDVALEARTQAVAAGFDIKITTRRLTKNNLQRWEEFVKAKKIVERDARISKRQKEKKQVLQEKVARKTYRQVVENIEKSAKVLVDLKHMGDFQVKKFGLTDRKYSLNFKKFISKDNIRDIGEQFQSDLDRSLRKVTQGLHPEDQVWLELVDSKTDIHVNTGKMSVSNMSASVLIDKIRRLLNSNKSVSTEAVIIIHIYQKPRGGTRKRPVDYEAARTLKSVITVLGSMNDCFFQCIALEIARFKKQSGNASDYNKLTSNKHVKETYRVEEAKKLYVKCSRHYEADPQNCISNQIGIDEVPHIEKLLNVSVNVFDWGSGSFIYKTGEKRMVNIYLLYKDNHYDILTSMKTFMGNDYFCEVCYVGYSKVHKCVTPENSTCPSCKKQECEGLAIQYEYLKAPLIRCEVCNFSFFGPRCLAYHQSSSKCAKAHKCLECKLVYDPREEKHECGFKKCLNCKLYCKTDEHKCFHVRRKLNAPSDKILVYDLETDPNSRHKVLCGVLTYPYHELPDQPPNGAEVVDGCFVFRNFDDMCKYMFDPCHKGFKAYAHYSGKFDVHFIRDYMAREAVPVKKQTANGCKFLSITTYAHHGIRLLDSYNIAPIPLAKFPKTFGLTEMKKGYFPYTFVTEANKFDVLPKYPPLSHYGPQRQKTKDERDALTEWYMENKDCEFDIWKEMVEYCVSDVKILSGGIKAYRDELLGLTGAQFDITEYMTMASAAQRLYQALFIPENTIAVIKEDLKLNQSRKETMWLNYLEKTRGGVLDRQKKIGDYFVDGYCSKTKTVYEFLGCFWHGCEKCYDPNTRNNVSKKTMADLHKATLRRQKYLSCYHKYEAIWEHEFDNDKAIKQFYENADEDLKDQIEMDTPANLKDAFFGGNTQCFKNYALVDGKIQKIRYLDFTSLYPSVNYSRYRPVHKDHYHEAYRTRYPIGHPERMAVCKVLSDLSNVIGVVKCKVIPSKLYSPILPQKKDGKLLFHTKPFVGSFFSEELKFAMSYGYEIAEIYDVINFPLTFERPEIAENLFSGYVKMFVKIKLESDGPPANQDLDEFISQVAMMDGIHLDKSQITTKNEGRRFIAKQFLNSLWGKYGQNLDRDEMKTFTDPDLFHKFMADDKINIKKVYLVNENVVDVCYSTKTPYLSEPIKTNLAIALATTAYARMRLQEAMQIVGKDLIYCDTDSLFFIDNDEAPHPIKTSSLLGDLKDELDGGWITEFVCTGPKSYSYVAGTKVETKIKGFRLNLSNQEILNHDALKKMVMARGVGALETKDMQFVIDKHERTITTKIRPKVFQVVFDKRIPDWKLRNTCKVLTMETEAF